MQSWESRRATVRSSFRPAGAKSGHEPLCGAKTAGSGHHQKPRNFQPRPRYHGDNRNWRGQIPDKGVGDGILYAGEMTIMRIVQKIQRGEFIITCNIGGYFDSFEILWIPEEKEWYGNKY